MLDEAADDITLFSAARLHTGKQILSQQPVAAVATLRRLNGPIGANNTDPIKEVAIRGPMVVAP